MEALAQTMRDPNVTLIVSAFYSIMEAGCYFPHLALKQVQTAMTTHEGQTGFSLLASFGRKLSIYVEFCYPKMMWKNFYHSISI